MKALKVLSGFAALILAFIALSFLVGPFIPSIKGTDLSTAQHLLYALVGVICLGVAVLLWLSSTKKSASK